MNDFEYENNVAESVVKPPKKVLLVIFVMCILLCGCSENATLEDIKLPTDILAHDSILSYYGDYKDFEEAGFEIVDFKTDRPKLPKGKNYIEIKNNKICLIHIADENVTTYKKIKLGSSAEDIKKAFKYEQDIMEFGIMNVTLFDGRQINEDELQKIVSEVRCGFRSEDDLFKLIFIEYQIDDSGFVEAIRIMNYRLFVNSWSQN